MVSKQTLIYVPLIFMFTISMFSLAGLGSSSDELGSGYVLGLDYQSDYVYDYTGRQVAFSSNYSSVDSSPFFYKPNKINGVEYVSFYNTSWNFFSGQTYYWLYEFDTGNSTGNLPITWERWENGFQALGQNNLINLVTSFSTSYGLIAFFIALVVAIAIIGFRIVDSGESETSIKTIAMGAGFIAIWGVFSVISLNLLATIPLGLGAIFYFGLTLSYVVGLLLNIGQ